MKRHKSLWVYLGIAGFWLGIYLFSVSALPTGYADSDELAIVAYHRNLAHPPGYAGLTDLTHGLIAIFSGLPPSLIANSTSAIFQALALLMVGFWLSELGEYHGLNKSQDKQKLADRAAWLTMMVLGSSFFWWTYATIYEVMPLANLLMASGLWSATKWFNLANRNDSSQTRFWWLTWILSGLMIGHYQPAGLLFPGWIALCYLKSKPAAIFKGGVVALMAFGIINFSLIFGMMNRQETEFGWFREPGLPGAMKILSRQDMGNFSFAQNRDFKGLNWEKWLDPIELAASGLGYLSKLMNHLGWPMVFISLVGLLGTIRENRGRWRPWWLMLGVAGVLFSIYVDESKRMTDRALFSGVAERQLFMGEILLMAWFWWAVIRFSQKLKNQVIVVWVGGISLIVGQFWYNHRLLIDKSNREMVAKVAEASLNQLDPESMIICTTDIDCYSLIYANEVEKIRTDVLVMPYVSSYRIGWLLKNPETYPYHNFNEPDFLPQLIAWNLSRRPVYLTQGISRYMEYSGLESGPFYLQPEGNPLVFRVTQEIPAPYNPTNEMQGSINDCDSRDHYCQGIIASWSNNWAYAGYLGLKYRSPMAAESYIKQAIRLDPSNLQAEQLLTHQDEAMKEIGLQSDQLKASDYYQKGLEGWRLRQVEEAEINLRYATYLEPKNPDYLQSLMDFYQEIGHQDRFNDLNYFFLSNLSKPSDLTPK